MDCWLWSENKIWVECILPFIEHWLRRQFYVLCLKTDISWYDICCFMWYFMIRHMFFDVIFHDMSFVISLVIILPELCLIFFMYWIYCIYYSKEIPSDPSAHKLDVWQWPWCQGVAKPLASTALITTEYTRGTTLCMRPTNERWRYIVTSSLIGWAHT